MRQRNCRPPIPTYPQAPPIERARLRLRLNVGDRFPLRKVVEQELIQTFPGEPGRAPESSRSRLDMLLAITVEDAGNEGARLAVRYDRIRYHRDVGRTSVDYDSAQPPIALPLELAAYQGMVGNGFSFWIGADNRIAGVEGFAAFVQTALATRAGRESKRRPARRRSRHRRGRRRGLYRRHHRSPALRRSEGGRRLLAANATHRPPGPDAHRYAVHASRTDRRTGRRRRPRRRDPA